MRCLQAGWCTLKRIETCVESAWLHRLMLTHDKLLSNVAFKSNVRRYIQPEHLGMLGLPVAELLAGAHSGPFFSSTQAAFVTGRLTPPTRSDPLYFKKLMRGKSRENLCDQLWGFNNSRKVEKAVGRMSVVSPRSGTCTLKPPACKSRGDRTA